jgi:NTE family protein
MLRTDLKADAVFEGGGVKGIGLAGAVSVAEERGYQLVNVAGTSAGAIIASLIAAGYSGKELHDELIELDSNRFKDATLLDRIPLVGPITSVVFEKGIYEGKFFEDWIRTLLQKKDVRTFKDLILEEYKDDKRYRFKLRVIASDLTRGRLLVLPQDIEDYGIRPEDLNVAAAIRMSMSLPFFYEPIKLKNMIANQASYVVDGGVLSNFPVWLFDAENGIPEWPTFGFKLVEPGEGKPNMIKGPISLISALISTMTQAHDARYIEDMDFVRTIAIPTLGVGTTDFDISREKSEALYESGRSAAEKFFDTWNFDKYVEGYRRGKARSGRSEQVRSE